MKPALTSITVAVFLGLLGHLIGRPLDIYDYVVVVFATSIVTWTIEQYDHHRQQ